jgi:hypothetical protein
MLIPAGFSRILPPHPNLKVYRKTSLIDKEVFPIICSFLENKNSFEGE